MFTIIKILALLCTRFSSLVIRAQPLDIECMMLCEVCTIVDRVFYLRNRCSGFDFDFEATDERICATLCNDISIGTEEGFSACAPVRLDYIVCTGREWGALSCNDEIIDIIYLLALRPDTV